VEILARMAEVALDAEAALASGGNIAGRRERVRSVDAAARRTGKVAS